MTLLQRIVLLGSVFGAMAGCADRSAGNSLETENALAIAIDTLVPARPLDSEHRSVGVLRLEGAAFPFERVRGDARDLAVHRADGSPVPFRVVFWDSAKALGRIELGLDSTLLRPGALAWLLWQQTPANRSDSLAVWQAIAPSQRLLLTSTLLSDFESGKVRSLLPESTSWYSVASESTTVSSPAVLSDSATGGAGKVMHVTYQADSLKFRYVVVGLDLGPKPRVMRTLDSLVLRVRGSGKLSLAFDRLVPGHLGKAWLHVQLTPSWKRLVVRPGDLLPAGGSGGNIGWAGVRDSVTNLTFLLAGGSDFYVDDIRLHGLNRTDFR